MIREVQNDAEHETLLIEENLRRRQLSTSSMARAIKRLYEIRGTDGTGPKQDGATVAQETGKSERTIKTLRTIADLIPELSAMLDAKTLTQKVAYQLAQMDEEGQLSTSSMARAIKRLYEIRGIDGAGRPKGDNAATVAELASETGKSERTVRTLRTLADLIPELSAMLDAKTLTQKVAYQLAQMDEEGQLSTSSMARAIKRLYEIRGIDGAGRPKGDNGATVAQLANEFKRGWQTVR